MATQASDTSGKSRARGSIDELAVIAQRAQAFTNASGAAIALVDSSSDELVCRARSGANTPEVGTALRVEGTFTGLCIQSGKELRCDDAETDTRVDTLSVRALGIRSMVVTPIKGENRVVGVLLVFAPAPHAFTITHVAVLKTMADQIAVFVHRDRKPREEGQPEIARAPMPAPAAKPAPPAAPPMVMKAAARAALPSAPKVESVKVGPVAADPGTAPIVRTAPMVRTAPAVRTAPPVRKDTRRSEPKADRRASYSDLEAAADEGKKSPNQILVVGILTAAVLAGSATFVYRRMQSRPSQRGSEATTTQQSEPAAAVPGPGASQTATAPPPTNGFSGAAPATAAAPQPLKPSAAEHNRRGQPDVFVSQPTPNAVELSSGQSKIEAPASEPPAPAAAPAPTPAEPPLTVGPSNPESALSELSKPSVSSTPTMVSQSALDPILVLKRVSPIYPAIARVRRLSGRVVIEGLVGKDGKISNLKFISGPPVFRDAAFDAVKQWTFRAARLNGQAIDQSTQISVDFKP